MSTNVVLNDELVTQMDRHLASAADAESKRAACRSVNDFKQADVYANMCEEHTLLAFKLDDQIRNARQPLDS